MKFKLHLFLLLLSTSSLFCSEYSFEMKPDFSDGVTTPPSYVRIRTDQTELSQFPIREVHVISGLSLLFNAGYHGLMKGRSASGIKEYITEEQAQNLEKMCKPEFIAVHAVLKHYGNNKSVVTYFRSDDAKGLKYGIDFAPGCRMSMDDVKSSKRPDGFVRCPVMLPRANFECSLRSIREVTF